MHYAGLVLLVLIFGVNER